MSGKEPNPRLAHLLHTGRSLVFCPTRAEAARIQAMCERLYIPNVCTNNNRGATANFNLFQGTEIVGPFVMIAVVPYFSTGVRFDVHRVIWIGDVPHTTHFNYPTYAQSIRRALDASIYAFPVGAE